MRKKPIEIRKSAVYTLPEVAEWLRISQSTARRWIKKGHLRGVKWGNDWKFLGADLLNVMSNKRYDDFVRNLFSMPEDQADAALAGLMQD